MRSSLHGCLAALALAACSSGKAALSPFAGTDRGGSATGGANAVVCSSDSNCASGLVCASGQCVSSADQKPPEKKVPVTGPVPAATPDFVFALDPAGGQAVRVTASTLAIEAIPLGGAPSEVWAFPGVDKVLVLNPGNDKVHLLDATASGPTAISTIPLDRRQDHLRLSPDGTWALAFTDPNTSPDQGAEGIVSVVHLAPAGAKVPGQAFDRAGGYRVSDVFFRAVSGVTKGAAVVALDSVAFVDLSSSPPPNLPPRQPLPAFASADLATRDVVATPDGAWILIRSFTAPEIAVIDVDAQTVTTLTLTDVPTDLEIEPGGTVAVAVLRATAKAALIQIPADLTQSDGGPTLLDLGGFNAGQIALSPVSDPTTGPFGLLFTNATPSMEIARLDLQGGKVTAYPDALQKLVDGVGIAPDGKTAVIVHRPDPNPTTTDAYARQVALDQGYSMFDLASGFAQLKRTGTVAVQGFAFTASGGAAAVALRDDTDLVYGVDALDLRTLVADSLSLASPPEFVGAFPQVASQAASSRVWVTQIFPGGRISFVDLHSLGLETVTGFELNSQIQN